MKKRTVCIVTTSRADYGLLYWLMKEVREDPALQLQVIVAGMHLESEFGDTYKVVEADGFKLDSKIEMSMNDDSAIGILKSLSEGLVKFGHSYSELKPDLIVLLGDRYELFSAAVPALLSEIPIAHIHGGETTEGSFDEATRHCVTKMASLHFASTEVYRKRIVQLGEKPECVFNYGAPGLDNIYRIKCPSKKELEEALEFDLKGTVALVTCHPVTLEAKDVKEQISNVLDSIVAFDFKAVFTMANADIGGSVINDEIKKFCNKNPKKYKLFKNLGQRLFFGCLKTFDLMIGNSSSGMIESSSFNLPVVNIGDRQKGRVRGENVIDVDYSKASIKAGISTALSSGFINKMREIKNPYDKYCDGKTSWKIKEKLKEVEIARNLVKKHFNDIEFDLRN